MLQFLKNCLKHHLHELVGWSLMPLQETYHLPGLVCVTHRIYAEQYGRSVSDAFAILVAFYVTFSLSFFDTTLKRSQIFFHDRFCQTWRLDILRSRKKPEVAQWEFLPPWMTCSSFHLNLANPEQ